MKKIPFRILIVMMLFSVTIVLLTNFTIANAFERTPIFTPSASDIPATPSNTPDIPGTTVAPDITPAVDEVTIPHLEQDLQSPLLTDEIWILIDLSDQYLYLYQYNELLIETGVVTGHATRSPTNIGEFAIYSKEANRMLRGSDYACFVEYWMPFDGGIGLHDASWRSSSEFGTDAYLTNGSHGCVNMPPAVAGTVYDYVKVGTRIVVQA